MESEILNNKDLSGFMYILYPKEEGEQYPTWRVTSIEEIRDLVKDGKEYFLPEGTILIHPNKEFRVSKKLVLEMSSM